ncbi:MAG: large conductance mechanosensitive channel protein MscL [Clostridiaceae bacterium]
MSFFKEFKEFALKGNVMDLAIGVVIGAAFGKIVTSLVNDIIMPLTTLITGNIDFVKRFIVLNPDGNPYTEIDAARTAGRVTLNYGLFITNIIDFLIIALSIFIIVKQLNRFKRKPEPAPVTTKICPYCQTSIHIDAVKCPNCTSNLK